MTLCWNGRIVRGRLGRSASMPKRFNLPDVRDGLTHRERIVLWCLHDLQKEHGDGQIPTGMLYRSVFENVNMTVGDMKSILVRFVGHELPT